jgi:hypothetical protein
MFNHREIGTYRFHGAFQRDSVRRKNVFGLAGLACKVMLHVRTTAGLHAHGRGKVSVFEYLLF